MKILIIQTGGTIDKDYPRTTNGYAFEISDPASKRILEKINAGFEFEVMPLLQKDSTELTSADRQLLLDSCKQSHYEKIIITHGTDTMIETAEFLAPCENKTIVITGAMRPQRFSNTDADFNLGVAIGALNLLNSGVYIAMNGLVIEFDKSSRDMQSGRFIFK